MDFRALPPRVNFLIERLTTNFWNEWKEEIALFPDTADSTTLGIIAIQAALINITMDYITGFPSEHRQRYLEEIIKNLRYIEIQIRDTE